MESLRKLILLILLTVISARQSSCGSLGFGGGLRSEDLSSIDRYVSSGLPYSSDGFVFNSGTGPVIVKVEEPNKVTVTRAVEQSPSHQQQAPTPTSYYRSLPSVIPEGYEGVASTSFLLGHPIPSSSYSTSSPTSYTTTQSVYSSGPYQSPSHLSYSTNLPPPSYQYQPPQELQRQPQPTMTYNSIPSTPPAQHFQPQHQETFTRLTFQPQAPSFQPSPQPQQFQSFTTTQFPQSQSQPQFATSAQPAPQFSTSAQPQQYSTSTSTQPQFQGSAQPQQFQTSARPQQQQQAQFQSSPQPQPQQFQQLQSQAFPLTQAPQTQPQGRSQASQQQPIRNQNALRPSFPEKDEFGYDRSLIPTNFIGGTGYRSREELVTNPVVEQAFNSDSELPEHLRNPFYSNSAIAQMLAQESLPAQGEHIVGNWNTNKIQGGKVRDLLNGAGFL